MPPKLVQSGGRKKKQTKTRSVPAFDLNDFSFFGGLMIDFSLDRNQKIK